MSVVANSCETFAGEKLERDADNSASDQRPHEQLSLTNVSSSLKELRNSERLFFFPDIDLMYRSPS